MRISIRAGLVVLSAAFTSGGWAHADHATAAAKADFPVRETSHADGILAVDEAWFWDGGTLDGRVPDGALCDLTAPCPVFAVEVADGGRRLRVGIDTPERLDTFVVEVFDPQGALAGSDSNANQFNSEVLVDAPALLEPPADERSFARHFRTAAAGQGVVTFANLGGDAILVAPCPEGPPQAYSHLARFVREGSPDQQDGFRTAVGEALEQSVTAAPLWLSTSGLGVAWLHMRLDSQPKYYTYRPYRERT